MTEEIIKLVSDTQDEQKQLAVSTSIIDSNMIKLSEIIISIIDKTWNKYFSDEKDFSNKSCLFNTSDKHALLDLKFGCRLDNWAKKAIDIHLTILHFHGPERIERVMYFKENKWYYDSAIEITDEEIQKEYGSTSAYWDAWEVNTSLRNNFVEFKGGPSAEKYCQFKAEVNSLLGGKIKVVDEQIWVDVWTEEEGKENAH